MRRLVTGIDEHGRSCVISDDAVAFAGPARGGVITEPLFRAEGDPTPPHPPGKADRLDLGQGVSWMLVHWEASHEWPMHYTDTIDLDVVLSGAIELVLDDGAHRLEPGDSVVVNGVDHAWRAGPEGCVMSVATIGTPRD